MHSDALDRATTRPVSKEARIPTRAGRSGVSCTSFEIYTVLDKKKQKNGHSRCAVQRNGRALREKRAKESKVTMQTWPGVVRTYRASIERKV